MIRTLVIGALFALLLGPATVLATVTALIAHAVGSSCATAISLDVADVPDVLITTTSDGSTVELNRTQLTHAATIIQAGSRIEGVGRDGILVALMAALTESSLRMLTNTSAYPHSTNYPNDGNGSDHDSLGLFQMRPATGWGTVAELMDPTYQAAAFFGGPTGPNHGSPRGLLDIPGWKALPKGAAAQEVEVSRYPHRYARFEPVAEQILATLTSPASGRPEATTAGTAPTVAPPEVTRTVHPLPAGTWSVSSEYGMRRHPVFGGWRMHTGIDMAAALGTPVLAAAAGRVVVAEHSGSSGNHIGILHTLAGQPVVSVYKHLREGGRLVAVGDAVKAGQVIGEVGSTGTSTGPHLHYEIRPGGFAEPASDPSSWLDAAPTDGEVNLDDVHRSEPPQPRCALQDVVQ
ncbi:M23 family metallopeptidase [Georgenia subflava]|uniref:Peptidoglycan DD-metalloendopeptidase family protein n=1 Tax=Georgenia subflava TaxID=1622177 RepID=A0A6N7EG51_9MICO|nr:M23 family metallopeptidase [Georgenia subflava]MPV35938.1 peptidoglycan DD-metalloendopeptidase family protein [Georgenia subflava]